MKPNPWMFPALALLAGGGWIASQKHSSAVLEKEITVIAGRIRQTRAAGEAEMKARDAETKAAKEKEKKIDWKDIAGKMAGMRDGTMPDMRTMMRMQRLLMDLTPEELAAQLDEINALDIEPSSKKQLQGMIGGILAEKEPKLVLERFGDLAGDEMSVMQWQVGSALKKWAEKDPAGAAKWMDDRIAAGRFESKALDGKSGARLRLESMLVSALVEKDPAAATARVLAVPEDQREDLFQNGFFFQVGSKNEAAFAQLVRDSLDGKKASEVLSNQAGMMAMQGYDRVDSFIRASGATEEEKGMIVTKVLENQMSRHGGGEINAEDLEKARKWAATQAPAEVDKATGEALAGTLWRGGDFAKSSALVLKYHESTGKDDVLAAFLKSQQVLNRSSKEAAPLIDQIRDPALREQIRQLPEYQKATGKP